MSSTWLQDNHNNERHIWQPIGAPHLLWYYPGSMIFPEGYAVSDLVSHAGIPLPRWWRIT